MMTKPWWQDEEWKWHEADPHAVSFARSERDGFLGVVRRIVMADGRTAPARMRLAATAPEAIRLLLELEWSGSDLNGYGEEEGHACPSCRMPQVQLRPIAVDGHAPDCRLVSALRKAGARE